MKKKKILTFLLASFALLLSVTMANGDGKTTFQQTVVAEADFGEYNLPSRAYLGTEITLPATTITVDGEKIAAKTLVTTPSGINKTVQTFTVTEEGRYTVEFYVVKNGVKYTEKRYVTVYQEAFSKESALSSLSYEIPEAYAAFASGLSVSLNAGDALCYNNVIEMEEKTVDDSLLSFYMTPSERGVKEVNNIKITFSDMYDESNNVVVSFHNVGGNMYLRATVNNGTESKGLETTSLTNHATRPMLLDYYQGNNYFIWSNAYGSIVTFPMDGSSDGKITFSMDYAEKKLFATTSHNNRRRLVVDLDDERIYENGFHGFKSGKAFVKIESTGYIGSKFNFVLSDIDGKAVTNEFEKEIYAPVIEVDTMGYKSVPHALVGESYPVFTGTAKSELGNDATLTTTVYYGYYTKNRIQLPVKEGRFATDFEGTYTMEYKAVDEYGNESVKLIDVEAKPYAKLSASVKNTQNAFIVGQKCIAPELEIFSSYGAETVEVTAEAMLKADNSIKYPIVDGEFLPLYSGEYTITYRVKDFAEMLTVEHGCTVGLTDTPAILEEPILPKYLIANATYELPSLNGFVFTENGNEMKQASVTVKENGIALSDLNPNAYKVGKCERAEIIYTVTNGGAKQEYVKELPVIDVGYGGELKIPSYFYNLGEEFTTELTSNAGMNFFSSTNDGLKIEFIREILASEFTARIGKVNVDSTLHVELTDFANPTQCIRLSYENTKSGATVYLNGERVANISSLTERTVNLSYGASMQELFYEDEGACKVNSYKNGEAFNGFSSGKVYIRFFTEGTEPTGFTLVHICGQQFSTLTYDLVRPYFEVQQDIRPQTINTVYSLEKVKFADVLDPCVNVQISVLNPNKECVTATDGTLLKNLTSLSKGYEILLDEYGQYSVSYVITDSVGNQAKGGYSIRVIDNESPTITLTGGTKQCKVGENIKIPTVALSDNVDDTDKITSFVVIKDTLGTMTKVEGDSFVAEKGGTYEVYVYAMDSSGNSAMKSYKVVVS